jgi:hypothetical protein
VIVTVRDLDRGDLDGVLAINQASTPAVGSLDLERLTRLHRQSSIALVATVGADVVGFCLVLSPSADYASVNFRWFRDRYDDFAYLDRVAIGAEHRSQGIGAALYDEVERRADAAWFTLEVNLRPRNEGSLRFHARQGFVEVGQQETDYGFLVSMQAKRLR